MDCVSGKESGASSRRYSLIIALVSLLVTTGCATSTVNTVDQLSSVREENPRVLVMTPDLKYFRLTAGGVAQAHGEWTNDARKNFAAALEEFARERGTNLVKSPKPSELSDEEIDLIKLYSAVGNTITTNYFGPMPLPTKRGQFDWSLGPGVKVISDKYGADYALFTYYRDYQASGGRIAFAALAAAAGVGISVGSEQGFAALVDLKTGDIVWFKKVNSGKGELRDPEGASDTVDQLFSDLPGA